MYIHIYLYIIDNNQRKVGLFRKRDPVGVSSENN